MINSPTAEEALSVSTDGGGMDYNVAVILVRFVVFSPGASKIQNSLVVLLLKARLVWAVLGMHSVVVFIIPLISRTVLLFGFLHVHPVAVTGSPNLLCCIL